MSRDRKPTPVGRGEPVKGPNTAIKGDLWVGDDGLLHGSGQSSGSGKS